MLTYGMLSDIFEGAGAKYLTDVEINSLHSNQHEFQGVGAFRRFLGTSVEKASFPATFYWLDDKEESEILSIKAYCTWSDVRANNPERSAEYHLYYAAASDPIVHKAVAGDLLIVAKTNFQELLVIVCPSGTTIERQLLWLFGLNPLEGSSAAKSIGVDDNIDLNFGARSILEILGIPFDVPQPDALDELLAIFGDVFPSTSEFSQFARARTANVDPLSAPDETLISWMDHEELLFRHLERHIVSKRLSEGFSTAKGEDVDGFIAFSLSVQNRRKARAGYALGHHVEALLLKHKILHTREALTELKKRPDFLFPGQNEYHDPCFETSQLTMLGAKRTCKERWRQVLSEANRIDGKHLLTLEPAISHDQTEEMKSANLQLVIPHPIFASYSQQQQDWLMDVKEFLTLVKNRQEAT